ncbi:MAG: hypothetical protein ACREE9_15230 [Stellaceae bacterium]
MAADALCRDFGIVHASLHAAPQTGPDRGIDERQVRLPSFHHLGVSCPSISGRCRNAIISQAKLWRRIARGLMRHGMHGRLCIVGEPSASRITELMAGIWWILLLSFTFC